MFEYLATLCKIASSSFNILAATNNSNHFNKKNLPLKLPKEQKLKIHHNICRNYVQALYLYSYIKDTKRCH